MTYTLFTHIVLDIVILGMSVLAILYSHAEWFGKGFFKTLSAIVLDIIAVLFYVGNTYLVFESYF